MQSALRTDRTKSQDIFLKYLLTASLINLSLRSKFFFIDTLTVCARHWLTIEVFHICHPNLQNRSIRATIGQPLRSAAIGSQTDTAFARHSFRAPRCARGHNINAKQHDGNKDRVFVVSMSSISSPVGERGRRTTTTIPRFVCAHTRQRSCRNSPLIPARTAIRHPA
jgi:hypothetical protein